MFVDLIFNKKSILRYSGKRSYRYEERQMIFYYFLEISLTFCYY